MKHTSLSFFIHSIHFFLVAVAIPWLVSCGSTRRATATDSKATADSIAISTAAAQCWQRWMATDSVSISIDSIIYAPQAQDDAVATSAISHRRSASAPAPKAAYGVRVQRTAAASAKHVTVQSQRDSTAVQRQSEAKEATSYTKQPRSQSKIIFLSMLAAIILMLALARKKNYS